MASIERPPQGDAFTPATRPISCPAAWRLLALRLLAATDEATSLAELAAAIDSFANKPEADWQGLIIIPSPTGPAAALWVQPQPGNTARLWPPANQAPGISALLHAARCWASEQGFSIVQAVIDSADAQTAGLLANNGFPHLVDLLYLKASSQPSRRTPHSTRQGVLGGNAGDRPAAIAFEPVGPLPSARLEALVGTIQDHSMDCPGLQEVLSPGEAIEGFKHQGQYTPDDWRILRHSGRDAGVLLLAPHPQTTCWELIYMGNLPAWRGQGLGQLLVDEALNQAARHNASLLLSVDRRNQAARRLYQRSGFSVYAERSLYAASPGRQPAPMAAAPCEDT
jgi:GNAT superfamily N-acetyltransferase